MRLVIRVILCSLPLALLGCSGNTGPKASVEQVVPASGTLTYQGKPLEFFQVSLTPSDGRRVAVGITDATGKFTLGTNGQGDGAPPGTHKVAVVWVGPPPSPENAGKEVVIDDPSQLPKPSVKIPDKYASATTSGLTQEVPAGGSDSLKIDLQ